MSSLSWLWTCLTILQVVTCNKHFSKSLVNGQSYLTINSVWSSWSEYSTCSRSCGGGASFRTRHCVNRIPTFSISGLCDGESRQFIACNKQPCPTSGPDFREMQCSVYNNKKMFGHLVREWEPITSQPNTCELTCLAKGTHFFYSFGKVLDGTRCNKDNKDMCINGECIPVGCDGELDSAAKEDFCMVCDGHNETCSRYQSVFVEPPPSKGYIGYRNCTVIPAGATHVEIVEHTSNFLAMVEGSQYVLNGDWSLHWSGNLDAGGTVFEYERQTNGNERLYTNGPTKRSLTLEVILTDSNHPNISISYWIPNKEKTPSEVSLTKRLESMKKQNTIKNTDVKKSHNTNDINNDKPANVVPYTRSRHVNEPCSVCEKVRGGRVKHFCSSDFVIHAEILDKRIVNGQLRFDVSIQHIYRNATPLQTQEYVWIQSTCNCPMIRPNKSYLIMGVNAYNSASGQSHLVILKSSLVRSWKLKDHEKWIKTQEKQDKLCQRFQHVL